MGRHKFRLSDMIPNAWFVKLRDMRARSGSAASHRVQASTPPPSASLTGRSPTTATSSSTPKHGAWLPHRASHYYTPRAGDLVLGSPPPPLHHTKASDTHFPPTRSTRRPHHRRRRSVKLAAHSVSSSSGGGGGFVSSPGCRCERQPETMAFEEAPDTPPCRRDRFVGYSDDDDEDGDRDLKKPTVVAVRGDDEVIMSATEIIIDLRSKNRPEKVLRPILTKPARREPELEDKHIDVATDDAVRRTAAVPEQPSKLNKPRRSASSARRLKTRANTARVSVPSKKCKPPSPAARSPALAESFAVVKSSRDPRRDFRESMEEMIAANRIRTAADLEDLLACYLALNAAEYHDLIVDVFERIWASINM